MRVFLFFMALMCGPSAHAQTPTAIIEGTIANNWVQAGLAATDRLLDFAIQGSGFFMMEDPNGTSCFSRRGRFELTEDGYLLNRELGKHLVTIVDGTSLERLNLRDVGRWRGSSLLSIRVELDGQILGFYRNGYSRKLGRVALALFQNQRKLARVGHCLTPTLESGDPHLDFAQKDGRGSIHAWALETIDEQVYNMALDAP